MFFPRQQIACLARVLGCLLTMYAPLAAGPPLKPITPPAKAIGAKAPKLKVHKPKVPRTKGKGRVPRTWPCQGDPHVEKIRKCLLKRESEGHYAVVDPSKRWFGGYQFAMVTSNTAARRMKRPDLVGVPANKWSPADQDAAFYVIYDCGRGRKHWAGGRYPCK